MPPFEKRSKEAPMDFSYDSDSKRNPPQSWLSSPQKPTQDNARPQTPTFGPTSFSFHDPFRSPSQPPAFGSNPPTPFNFRPPSTTPMSPITQWAPPPNFSPGKAFPSSSLRTEHTEVQDVSMESAETSTPPLTKRPSKDNLTGGELVRSLSPSNRRAAYKSRERDRGKDRERVRERKRGWVKSSRPTGESDVGSSDDDEPLAVSNHYNLHLPTPSLSHGEVPYLLLGYLQFFFNLSLVLAFLYLAIQFIVTVQRDVDRRVTQYSSDILHQIQTCTALYLTNRCAPTERVPMMEKQCTEWETCMNQDPTGVGRAKVGAETFAEIINGFVDPISWKTMGFTLVTLSFLVVFINTALSFYRSKHAPSHPSPPPPRLAAHPSFLSAPQSPFPQAPPQPPMEWGRTWSAPTTANVYETPRKRRAATRDI